MQARAFRSNDEEDDETDDDFSDDEELQSPIDEVDPFVFFVDSTKGKYISTDIVISNLITIISCMQLCNLHY